MEMFVYDMIQGAFSEHQHYHQHDESMTRQLSKSCRQTIRIYITTISGYIMFKNNISYFK